jgi:flagellar basal body-associated protein FliL
MPEQEKQPAQQSQEGDEQKTNPPGSACAPDSTDPPARGVTPDSSPESTELDTKPPPVHDAGVVQPPSHRPKQKVELDIEGLRKENPPESETPVTPAAATAKKRRPIAIILVLATLLLGGLWLGYQHTRKRGMDGSSVKAPTQGSADIDAQFSSARDVHPSYDLAPFFVPIPGDERGGEVFLKVTVSLAFRDRVPSDEIGKKNFMLRNTITDILLSKRLSDLRSIEGKMTLKQEIRNVVNLRLTGGTVQTVYFEEFFIL